MLLALFLALDTTVHIRTAGPPEYVIGILQVRITQAGARLRTVGPTLLTTDPVTVDTAQGGTEVSYTVLALAAGDSTDVWISAFVRDGPRIRAGAAPMLLTSGGAGVRRRLWAQMVAWTQSLLSINRKAL